MQYSIIPFSEINWRNISFWQSPIWSRIILESWQAKESFYYGNIESTFLLIEIRSIGLGFYWAFSIGVRSFQIFPDWDEYIQNLQIFLRQKWVLFLQIEPIEELWIMNHNRCIIQKPYKKFITPYTRLINLSLSEDDILSQMHEKWRYNTRYAQKKWVKIEHVESTRENIDIWMNLLDDTLARDGFSWNTRTYYETFITQIESQLQWWLYFARFEWRVIAAGIFVFLPEVAIYYYGASSSDTWDKKIFAPYLLQWEVMREAKSRWIQSYDLLWIAQPGVENDPLEWVSFFKSRFGWEIIMLPEKMLFPLSWKYRYFSWLQGIKNLLKRR